MRIHREQLILKSSSENITSIDIELMVYDKCAEEVDKHHTDAALVDSYKLVAVRSN